MKNLAMAGLVAVGSCSSTAYEHYWMDMRKIAIEDADRIKLIAGKKGDRDLSGKECWVAGVPRCVVVFDTEYAFIVQEVANLKEELAQCKAREE